ncbi:MAG: Icc-like protein, partial [bacterium]|nr:Icc-like protein [bacterium]
MRILTVSDTVTRTLLTPENETLAAGDVSLIIACGDLPPEYLTSLRNRFDVPLYYVLGNHDIRYSERPPVGCTPLHRKIVHFNGINLLGFSGSRWCNGNINQYSEKQMARFVRKMRFTLWRKGGVDIVITHAPPRFIHDAEDPCHRGFRIFRWFIDKYQPSYFIHGH